MKKTIALIGNQNCGKTTLFNALTGNNQHVGNFPGVTIEKKSGFIKNHHEYKIVDLPGIYSLTPYTYEEIVSTQFLLNEQPDIIMNIIDASHLERNLYLTMQLMELDIPMILVFNMMDEVHKQGHMIDIEALSKSLQLPIIPISAREETGIQNVIKALPLAQKPICLYRGYYHQALLSIDKIIRSKAQKQNLPLIYCATRLAEKDSQIISQLSFTSYEQERLGQILKTLEKQTHQDYRMTFIQARYQVIDDLCQKHVIYHSASHTLTDKIDLLATHSYLGIPLFVVIMFFIFYMTFYVIGRPLQDIMANLVSVGTFGIVEFLKYIHVSLWLQSFISDGILAGVGSVLSFLPVILVLFFFLSILEDSGYSARIVFMMDSLLRKIGLNGHVLIPLLMGFGCSVPSIMATRTLVSEKHKKLIMLLIPFMSCSAKLPIYGMIISTFFRQKASLVLMSIYGLGILVALLIAFFFQTFSEKEDDSFVLELPPYRLPTFKNIYLNIKGKATDFIYKVFTTIVLVSIVIWFLQNFNIHFQMTNHQEESLLAYFGSAFSFLLAPLGFNDWKITTALLTGMSAKETIVSTLSVLTHSSSPSQLHTALLGMMTPASAYSFLVFTLLYTPCMATFATLKKELHSFKLAIGFVLLQTCIAYFVAFFVYRWICLFV